MSLLKSALRHLFVKNKFDLKQASLFYGYSLSPPQHLPSSLTQLPKAQLYQKLNLRFNEFKEKELYQLSQLCQCLLWGNIIDIEIWSQLIKKVCNQSVNSSNQQSLSSCVKSIKTYVCNNFKLQNSRSQYYYSQAELSQVMSQEQFTNLVSKVKQAKSNRIVQIHQKFSRAFDTKFNQIKQYGQAIASQSKILQQQSVQNLLNLFKVFVYVGLDSQHQTKIIDLLKPKAHLLDGNNFYHLVKCSQTVGEFDPFFKPFLIKSIMKQPLPTSKSIGIAFGLITSGVQDQQIFTLLTQKINNQKFLNRLTQLQLKTLHNLYHSLRRLGFKPILKNQYQLSQACRLCQKQEILQLFKDRNLLSDCLRVNTPISKKFTTFKQQLRRPHFLQKRIWQQLNKLKNQESLRDLKMYQSVKLCTYETDFMLEYKKRLIAVQISSHHYLNNLILKGKKNLKHKMLESYQVQVLTLSTRQPILLQLTKSNNAKPFRDFFTNKLQSIL